MINYILLVFCGYDYLFGVLEAPDSKVLGANTGPIWGRQDSGGPHVGPINIAVWGLLEYIFYKTTIVAVSH